MPNEWYGRLGLTEPGTEGAQEAAQNAGAESSPAEAGAQEPVSNADTGTSGQQTTVTEPVSDTQGQENNTAENAEESPKAQPEEQTQELTAQQRHENAARRRQQEAEAMQKKATEDVLKRLQIRNPYNDNKVISSIEEYEQYQKDMAKAKLSREVKSGELSMETLEEAVLASPKIRQALENADKKTVQAQEAQAQAGKAQYQADMQKQIAEIQKMNPMVKSMDDIIRMETGVQFAQFVRRGLTPVEAYKLANHDQIVSKARSAAEQAARNAAASTQHMQSTRQAAGNGINVSPSTRERYQRFCPNITDAEIAAKEKELYGK